MTYGSALEWAQRYLQEKEIGTPRLDALVLLEDVCGIDRAKLLTDPEAVIISDALRRYKRQVKQRGQQIPLAYVRQRTDFYGRTFYVDQRVLEPRPESETLIEELSLLIDNSKHQVTDIGTGSGALAITAKLEFPNINVSATDLSSDCITIAKKNAQNYQCQINFYQSDLLDHIPSTALNKATIIVANLPYVPSSWQINPPAMKEPSIAIFGGEDGLRLYERLFAQLAAIKEGPTWVLTESMPPQHPPLREIALNYGYTEARDNDFIQLFSRS